MNETSEHCDMIADYWPDDAPFPVGYHVTVPCMAADTGYRSFDNVFAIDDDGNMIFMEDQTRDMDKIDSHFGAGGLCRTSNFGFNMYVTNTMRICTRNRTDDNMDIHVPMTPKDPNAVFEDEVCSTDSDQLQWSRGAAGATPTKYDPLMTRVGTVPFFPSRDAEVYPEYYTGAYTIGQVEDMQKQGWGGGCEDFELPVCVNSTTDCPLDYRCLGGVCMSPDVQCISHDTCQSGTMCSGDGRCLQPMIVVYNNHNTSASFRVHTTGCGKDTSYSMLGVI